MSSPFRASEHSRSTPRSSPSRQRFADSRNGRVNGYHRNSRDSPNNDSPSRQLWEEFGRIVLDDDRNFKRSLDTQTAEQERLHRQALDEALAQHEAVRQCAERARERVELEIRREQRRREDVERQAVEEQKRKLAEEEAARERNRLADAKRRDDERKQREDLQRESEERRRRVEAQKQREEQEKAERGKKAAREKEEADRKTREEAASRERQQQAQQPQPPPQQPPPQQILQQPNGVPTPVAPPQAPAPQRQPSADSAATQRLVSSLEERKAMHQRYVALWRRLKKIRADTEKQCKDAGFRDLGELKRGIFTQISLINKVDKQANKIYLTKIEAILKQAATMPGPTTDIRDFLPSVSPTTLATATDTQYPSILLYLLHQFAKRTIRQLVTEGGADTEVCDPIGIIVVQVFARPEYQWQGHSLIDLLWAKYHVLCPQLFGMRSQEPRLEDDEYYRRITGLSAGFSAFTLRDFSRSKNKNPAPNAIWWEAMARILNVPAGQTQLTHAVILKSVIADFVPRILQLFGGAGKALLRKAIRDFPQKGPRTVPTRPGEAAGLMPPVLALGDLVPILQLRYGLTL